MKKMISIGALTLCFAALPAVAATVTVTFTPADGAPLVAVFTDNGAEDRTVSFNGSPPVAYTSDETTRTVCSTVNGEEDCATFETWGTSVGHSTPYTTKTGSTGVATVTAATE